MGYSILQIRDILRAELVCESDLKYSQAKQLLIDSRNLSEPVGVMFIALKTSNNDGHRFINELYEKGVRIFLVNIEYEINITYGDAAFIKVKDPLELHCRTINIRSPKAI